MHSQTTGAICADSSSGANVLDETSALVSSEDTFLQGVLIMLAIAAFSSYATLLV
jgi:hypothetical protein